MRFVILSFPTTILTISNPAQDFFFKKTLDSKRNTLFAEIVIWTYFRRCKLNCERWSYSCMVWLRIMVKENCWIIIKRDGISKYILKYSFNLHFDEIFTFSQALSPSM